MRIFLPPNFFRISYDRKIPILFSCADNRYKTTQRSVRAHIQIINGETSVLDVQVQKFAENA